MANMFLVPLETRTQETKILRWLNKMQARFAYRFFLPILDGVPRFGPPQDPNITIKTTKKC